MFYNEFPPYNNYKMSRFKKINFTALLDGAQKTLSVINQAIPVIYQIKPLYNNAKTALKVVNAIKEEPKKEKIIHPNKKVELNNSPTYFL